MSLRLIFMGTPDFAVPTLLALVAWPVGRLTRRPQLAYCLWLLVLTKLITPPIVSLPIEISGRPIRGGSHA